MPSSSFSLFPPRLNQRERFGGTLPASTLFLEISLTLADGGGPLKASVVSVPVQKKERPGREGIKKKKRGKGSKRRKSTSKRCRCSTLCLQLSWRSCISRFKDRGEQMGGGRGGGGWQRDGEVITAENVSSKVDRLKVSFLPIFSRILWSSCVPLMSLPVIII